MKRDEALEWAADYATRNKLFEPVTNSRGYADGWKPPTPHDKVNIITILADSVTRIDDEKLLRNVLANLATARVATDLTDMRGYLQTAYDSLRKYLEEEGN